MKDSFEIERLKFFRRQKLLIVYTFVANSWNVLRWNTLFFYTNKVFKNIEAQNR